MANAAKETDPAKKAQFTAIAQEAANTIKQAKAKLAKNPLSKLAEMILLVQAGLPYPKTVVAGVSALRSLMRRGEVPFGYPFILKPIDGTRGQHNFKIEDEAALTTVVDDASLAGINFMAQEFIPNDCDYRLTFLGGELQYILQRTHAEGSHLNNTSQGGKGTFIERDTLPPAAVEDALKSARAVYRDDFAGVDLMVGQDGKHWILEVNKSPEIQTGFQSTYKTKLLADYIARRLSA